MKTREKKTVYTGVKQDEMEQAFADYASADARMQKINATMDVEFTRIREKYQDELSKLQEKKEKTFDLLQAYAIENKDELFAGKKSLVTAYGVIGFRAGTPKLKTLKGFTWGVVTNLLQEFLPGYVRTVSEPAKDKLLADRDNSEVASLYRKVGVCVVQEETFYVKPKKEEI